MKFFLLLILLNIGICFSAVKYEIVTSSDNERVGMVLEHRDVSPLLRVGSGGILHDLDGAESYRFFREPPTQDKDDGSNHLLYAILALFCVIIAVFALKAKKDS
jgi:hypothetical protein